MTDFFERLAAQSALQIDGAPRSGAERGSLGMPGEPADIDIVAVPARDAGHPAASPAPSPPAQIPLPGVPPPEPLSEAPRIVQHRSQPDHPPPSQSEPTGHQQSDANPELRSKARPEPLEALTASPFTPDPAIDPPGQTNKPGEPVQTALDAVLRWIAQGERQRLQAVPTAAAKPSPAARRSASPAAPDAAQKASGKPAEFAPANEGRAAPPSPSFTSPAPPPRAPQASAGFSRRRPVRDEPNPSSPPSVTIGSIQITVDSGQPPAPAPPKAASAALPARSPKRSGAMHLRRHYIVPH